VEILILILPPMLSESHLINFTVLPFQKIGADWFNVCMVVGFEVILCGWLVACLAAFLGGD